MTALWLFAFAWTLALELPVYTLVLRRHFARWWAPCALALAVNALTHPLLWFAFPRLQPYPVHVAVSEACVIAVEALVVVIVLARHLPRATAANDGVLASALANIVSTLVGLVLIRIA